MTSFFPGDETTESKTVSNRERRYGIKGIPMSPNWRAEPQTDSFDAATLQKKKKMLDSKESTFKQQRLERAAIDVVIHIVSP